jgi:ferrochelatase
METAALVAFPLGRAQYTHVYQSRSGPPAEPWLEPDLALHLRALAGEGVRDVVLAPIGFPCDNMEVVYDLDVEAKARALELGLNLVRAETVGSHPRFVAMIRELVAERTEGEAPRLHLGTRGCAPDECAPSCCRAARSGA